MAKVRRVDNFLPRTHVQTTLTNLCGIVPLFGTLFGTLTREPTNSLASLVMTAHKNKVFDQHKQLEDFMSDVLKSLLRKGSSRGRHITASSREFYSQLYHVGGRMLFDWVSQIFLGPAARTIQNGRKTMMFNRGGAYTIGITEEKVKAVSQKLHAATA